jgi:hypothetical protein
MKELLNDTDTIGLIVTITAWGIVLILGIRKNRNGKI